MSVPFVIGGVVLIVATMIDFAVTALTVAGGGPITMRLVEALWSALLRCHRRRSIHRVLTWVGAAVLLMVLAV